MWNMKKPNSHKRNSGYQGLQVRENGKMLVRSTDFQTKDKSVLGLGI